MSAPERFDRPRWLGAALALVPVVFLTAWFIWPVGSLLARGLRPGAIVEMLRRPGIGQVVWFTLWQATASTLVTVIAGLAPAWVLARFRFPGHRLARTIILVPFVLPTVVVAAAFLALTPERFDRHIATILAAHLFFNIAVVVRTVGGLWEQLDPHLIDAARTLGAGYWSAFRRVTLPLLWPAILAASSIVFLFTATSFGVIRILGGPGRATIDVEIYLRAVQLGDLPGASALAALQLLVVGGLLMWWSRLQRRRARRDLRLRGTGPRLAQTRRERWAIAGIMTITLTALAAPMAALIAQSFRVGERWTLAAWRSLGSTESRPGVPLGLDPWGAVLTSVQWALAAMVVSVSIGLIAALAIANARRTWLLDTAIMVPLGASAVTIGFGIVIAYASPPLDLRSSPWIVPLVHALVAVPFVVRTVLPVIRTVPGGVLDAAATLGASPWQVWRRIEFPLIRGSIVAAAGFAFAVSLGEFGATSFLTRRGSETLPIAIDRLLGRTGDLLQAQGYALATILLVLTGVIVAGVDALRPLRGDGW